MTSRIRDFAIMIFASASFSVTSSALAAEESAAVVFDLPPVAAARAADDDADLVTVQLRLSSMIETTDVPRIDQWIVRCVPRDSAVRIADYAPRTQTASDLASPIQVKQSREASQSLGISLDGSYGHLARANAGSDRTNKEQQSVQFDRVAPIQAITASGTIHRGRGVYFKLRWTSQQILEGEKVFELTLDVPPTWRGSLIDVSVVAQSESKSSFTPWDRETNTIASDHFVVAVYRDGDAQAERRARAMTDAENSLRRVVTEHCSSRSSSSFTAMLRNVTRKFDGGADQTEKHWLDRLLRQQADPHLDPAICELPMQVRIAVLDYADTRDQFSAINGAAHDRVMVAKPAN